MYNKIDKSIFIPRNFLSKELYGLSLNTRNKLRAILSLDVEKGITILEKIRETNNEYELYKIESILQKEYFNKSAYFPSYFPEEYQTRENYFRLEGINIDKQLKIIDIAVEKHSEKLNEIINSLRDINQCFLQDNIDSVDEKLMRFEKKFGYSHFLLRKCALIEFLDETNTNKFSTSFIKNANVGNNNIIVNSLLQAYQKEQDFLVLKKAILNINDKGDLNQFTRDITRNIFRPFSFDEVEFSQQLQSNLQSSLIDALLFLKVNKKFFKVDNYKNIETFFEKINSVSLDINQVSYFYLSKNEEFSNIEFLFYKHSSVWLENDSFIPYRIFIDTFYEDQESRFFCPDKEDLLIINDWVLIKDLKYILNNDLTSHSYLYLKKIESLGNLTITCVFNYILYLKEGFDYIDNISLYKLMSKTRDLDKIINVNYVKNIAQLSNDIESNIIYYLLVSKKSKNESDNYFLRRTIQNILNNRFNNSVIDFITYVASKSIDVANYSYEVFTEDFLARLSLIITSTTQITETRAALHKWMGKETGEKAYFDRARTLLIDHQINRVRNEIDDNRIYVDSSRFIEWLKDEVVHDLNSILTNITHYELSDFINDPQLLQLIEKSYSAFCNNNIFGISSYLGRRIRHGTFKGHLFSSVINIENYHEFNILEKNVNSKWIQWKINYENCIDDIIKNYLHVESLSKRDGLLKPTIKNGNKAEVAMSCAQAIVNDFLVSKNTSSSILILLEYCWRMAEIDLRNINKFLKSRKEELLNITLLDEIKLSSHYRVQNQARDFVRDLQKNINDKLISMYGWFKRPISVSPKASLSLLYKAVVAEVKETFSTFDADTTFSEDNDIELIGGAYHVLYDAFYVVIYNAAKHGKQGGKITRKFEVKNKNIIITICSEIKNEDSENLINSRMEITSDSDIKNAQSSEVRSGIRKLYHLSENDKQFSIKEISCKNRQVIVSIAYILENLL